MLMSKKICKSSPEWEELGHFSIEKFMNHERAEELVIQNRAMNFLSGIIHRSFYSSTSQYHTEIRQKGRMYGFTSDTPLQQVDIEYDVEQDIVTDHIQNIIEEGIVSGDLVIWFNLGLFQRYLKDGNYSQIERDTGIPRTSIANAVAEAKKYIKKELKNRGINYEH